MPPKKKIGAPVSDIDVRDNRKAVARGNSSRRSRGTGRGRPLLLPLYADHLTRVSTGYQSDIQQPTHTTQPTQPVISSTNSVQQHFPSINPNLALARLARLDRGNFVLLDTALPPNFRAFLMKELEDREALVLRMEALLRANGYIRQDELYQHTLAMSANPVPIQHMSDETAKQLQATSIVLSSSSGSPIMNSPIWFRPPLPMTGARSSTMGSGMAGPLVGHPVSYHTPAAATPQADQLLEEEDRKRQQLHDLPDSDEQPRATSASHSSAPDMEIPVPKRIRISSSPLPPMQVNPRTNPGTTFEPRSRPQPTKSKYNVVPPAKDVVLRDNTRDMWPTTKQFYQHKATGTMRMMDEIVGGAPITGLEKAYSMPSDEILRRVCMLASTSLSVLEARGISREQFLDIAGRHEEGNKMDVADIMKQFYNPTSEREDLSDEVSDEVSDDGM